MTAPSDAAHEAYRRGRQDGLRLALTILAAEEEKWAALLGESRSSRTNALRETRHRTLRIAQSRLRTALGRLLPKKAAGMDEGLASALEKAGL